MYFYNLLEMKKNTLITYILLGILRGSFAQKTTNIIPYPTPTNPVEKVGWELIFQDEFEGDTLKPHWWPQSGPHGDESQWYTPRKENVFVKDGQLHLKAIKETVKEGYPYSSGLVFSSVGFGKGSYVEVKYKIPKAQGLWPAFWFWKGANETYHELDACEIWCHNTKRYCISDHYWDEKAKKIATHYVWIYPKTAEGKKIDMSTDYFIYAVYWDDSGIKSLMNNVLVNKQTEDIPQDPFQLILNLAVEGGKKGIYKPKPNVPFPQEFLIDYVRVYRRIDKKK
jgi:beta-glucanase (GH16 family)